MRRRHILVYGFALTPMASVLLTACGEDKDMPNAMAVFKWDRDVCTRCRMAISDRRFACQIRGGPKDTVFKFDDIGCAATWLAEKGKEFPWMADATTRVWVGEFASGGKNWLDATAAHYVFGKTSPMGYNFAAYTEKQTDSLSFDAMGQKTSSTWPANCLPGSAKTASAAAALSK